MSSYYDDGGGNPGYSYDYQRARQGGYQQRDGFGYGRPNRRSSFGGNGNNGRARKSSGCKIKIDADGNCFVNAWKKNRRNGDFTTLSLHYFKNSKFKKPQTSSSGKQWVFVIGTMCVNNMKPSFASGLLDITGKRCYITDTNSIATTGGVGGYWGTHIPSKRR